ncbi:MAG: 5-methyltetrahydropteroyltriglutamate--homocysteine S-methyltransferase [Absicoccus porci]|jgi:5-methyltetrahydropteroyltriglutamate--homocysteine methyltransferase|uniref:5-methyltetrahydropteroyltriglutamate-- homocysteine S-methyltransferase n=1 Tax=Absicoccus porci TaxID=2486576 RepID=UPI001569387C|nr:5-methyltetrahydropteroyltriglutamate--homocysteine S-methyltransferase [Absicoccus porci]MCI6087500.1 5-methyltetrahydropteroyltriglutamate--homocysteine S-methyltransferase [Absicoccus porci]MDD6459322.1 5-methyltetrahydropteroyltriglutamate--homocysteine S-methyltransferase [Absicoccus porci]MDD7329987.1 5-methyltetrahydropteroyltriglutamate--homocysteine S-methyltransferase [Absicoccus porci]MDY4738872.1 5-methyltetrahydropteroyltriglutamate--homocysteine S-methyltransferase [Absicoccus 
MSLQTPFRYDYVGSFLRPEKLKAARAQFDQGLLTYDKLKEVEDQAITDLITKIKSLGYHVITDGEFRRATWHLDFMWGFDGIGHTPTKTGLPFHDEAAMIDDTYLTGKVGLSKKHPFIDHFKFVKQFEDETTIAKQTIPAPAQFLAQFTMPFNRIATEKYYDSDTDLISDIVAAYGAFIQDLYDAGCRNLQLDDCTWGMMADRSGHLAYGVSQEGLLDIQKTHKDINNQVIANAPKDLIINTHVCRGNFHSTYANSGAYDPVADVLFGQENVNAYYLEFDDERSGGFEPLAKVSDDKKVVLGLVTTKSPKLENKEEVIARIHEAEKYVPLNRLYLSPQCGFASCEIGNKLTEEQQWSKLKLVKEIAQEVWPKNVE